MSNLISGFRYGCKVGSGMAKHAIDNPKNSLDDATIKTICDEVTAENPDYLNVGLDTKLDAIVYVITSIAGYSVGTIKEHTNSIFSKK